MSISESTVEKLKTMQLFESMRENRKIKNKERKFIYI